MAYPTVLQWMTKGGRSLVCRDRDVISRAVVLLSASSSNYYSTSVRRIPNAKCVFCNRGIIVSWFKSTSSDGATGKYEGPAFSYSSSGVRQKATPPPPPKESTSPTPGSSGFEDLDKPIKFSTSKAALWKASDTHGGGSGKDDMPRFQPLVISLSVGVFLLYFLYLREENDIDEMMKQPLWERVPGLERKQLEVLLQYNEEHGLPTADILNRLAIVRKQDDLIRRKEKGEAVKQRQLSASSSSKEQQSTVAVTTGAHHS